MKKYFTTGIVNRAGYVIHLGTCGFTVDLVGGHALFALLYYIALRLYLHSDFIILYLVRQKSLRNYVIFVRPCA